MGYYTHYKLEVHPAIKGDMVVPEEVIGAFRKEYEEAQYALNEDGSAEEESKWYEHEKDLAAFSKKYPHVLFILEGAGEEQGDAWKFYCVNGETQDAKIVTTFPEPDMERLLGAAKEDPQAEAKREASDAFDHVKRMINSTPGLAEKLKQELDI